MLGQCDRGFGAEDAAGQFFGSDGTRAACRILRYLPGFEDPVRFEELRDLGFQGFPALPALELVPGVLSSLGGRCEWFNHG